MSKQVPFLAISALMAVMALAAGIHQWWVWAIWAVVVAAQIAKGFGADNRLQPRPYEPPQRASAQFDQIDAEHAAQVQAWRDRHPE